jgi:hypothetical protein
MAASTAQVFDTFHLLCLFYHLLLQHLPLLLFPLMPQMADIALILKFVYTGQFKKKATLSHVCNEAIGEPKITRYTATVRKTLKICF